MNSVRYGRIGTRIDFVSLHIEHLKFSHVYTKSYMRMKFILHWASPDFDTFRRPCANYRWKMLSWYIMIRLKEGQIHGIFDVVVFQTSAALIICYESKYIAVYKKKARTLIHTHVQASDGEHVSLLTSTAI